MDDSLTHPSIEIISKVRAQYAERHRLADKRDADMRAAWQTQDIQKRMRSIVRLFDTMAAGTRYLVEVLEKTSEAAAEHERIFFSTFPE